jgi:hypothetical protein
MADGIKEFKEAIADGVRRLITVEQSGKQIFLSPPGRTLGTAMAFGGASGIKDDSRATTGYDPVTGETTVAFVLGVSDLDGGDIWSM